MHSSFGGQAQTRDKVERRRTLSRESLIPAPVVARQHWPDHGQHVTCRVRRVGVFDFGTGRVGYLPKSSGTGTGRDG